MPNQRLVDIKEAGLRSRAVMAWLRDYKLPAEPICYTVAYEYLFTSNEKLKDSVDAVKQLEQGRRESIEKIYQDNIIARHYADLTMQGKNVNTYVSEVLALLLQSQGEVEGITENVNQIKTALSKNEIENNHLSEKLCSQVDKLKNCSEYLHKTIAETNLELESLQDQYMTLKETASKDELTGLLDQKGLIQTVASALKHQENYPLSIIRIDIDHFKQLNDANGTTMGNAVLKHLAKAFSSQLKGSDIISRFEEDEFLVVLPNTPVAHGLMVADSLRKKAESISLKKKGSITAVKLTVSGGVSECNSSECFDKKVLDAQIALYRSKDLGRNCVNKEV